MRAAILSRYDDPQKRKVVLLKRGQCGGSFPREWLIPHLGNKWYLVGFADVD